MRVRVLVLSGTLLALGDVASGQEAGGMRLIEFASDDRVEWVIVNDGVMGGRSTSALEVGDEGIALFAGDLSLENNGGFASVRLAVPEGALTGASRVVLRVRGDGRQYQFRLREGRRFDGVAFVAEFGTVVGEWLTVTLPLESFEPRFRGYRPRGARPLDVSRIGQFGFMVADGQEGPFRLEIDWIDVER